MRSSQKFTLIPVLLALVALQLALIAWSIVAPSSALPVALADRPIAFFGLQAVALFAVLVMLWRTVLYARYRPLPGAADDELPALTVVIPAYNEGAQVLATVQSVMASDYPRQKLQIVAIDDGSGDDTWQWIQRSAQQFPDHVLALRSAKNQGKREALHIGFGRATGSVIVTIDSDSEVLPDALRNLVTPIVRDPRVGAVAGNVRVLDPKAGAIPAMIDVVFTSSFELVRGGQSEVGTVMCCPGALSAYRTDLVQRFKDRWAQATFMGQPATIGEDRAMTNYVLRMGYDVRFQANAIVLTTVPVRVNQLCKMLLRWARSDVRETLVLAKAMWFERERRWTWGAHINLFASAVAILAAPLAPLWLVGVVVMAPALLAWTALGTLITALVPAMVFGHLRSWRAAWWALPYGLYFLGVLSWIQPYGLLTPQRASWLTRTLPAAAPAPVVVES